MTLESFVTYFQKQWIKSSFSKWQLFQVPSGWSTTNSPIESFNNRVKSDFTKRLKYHLSASLEVFKEMVNYLSVNRPKFTIEAKVSGIMKKQAKLLLPLSQFTHALHNIHTYKQSNGVLLHINTVRRTCSCKTFRDKLVCKHLIAACIFDKV